MRESHVHCMRFERSALAILRNIRNRLFSVRLQYTNSVWVDSLVSLLHKLPVTLHLCVLGFAERP